MGNMVQDVAHCQGVCNSMHALTCSEKMASMVAIYIENSSPVVQYILSGAAEMMDFLLAALEKVNS